jgi:hypothetical protein
MKVFVCATVVAMVMGFVSSASAQEDNAALEDQIVVTYDEAPYVDAEGNIDYELGKVFAELVESYVDEDGTKWEVWLDEFGGHMWTEYLTTEGTRGAEDLFVPYYVVVYRSGLPYVYYTVPGTTCGYIEYASTCGTNCYKWNLCHDSSSRNCDPSNVTEIAARATSDYDYCDANYVGFYADPYDPDNGTWKRAKNDPGSPPGAENDPIAQPVARPSRGHREAIARPSRGHRQPTAHPIATRALFDRPPCRGEQPDTPCLNGAILLQQWSERRGRGRVREGNATIQRNRLHTNRGG